MTHNTNGEEPRLLHEFFDRAAQRWPERVAVDVPPGNSRPDRRLVTYAELRRQSDILADLLRPFVEGECVVAILVSRNSEHIYSSQLGVLKAGAAYACIDTAFSDEQVCDILEDSKAVALLTDSAGLARARSAGFPVEQVFDVVELIDQTSGPMVRAPQAHWLGPSSLAYVIYTSGTTGRPKGVLIEHGSITNLVVGDLKEFSASPGDRVGQSTSPAFDSSVEEIWLALAAGATIVVMDDETVRLGPDLISWLERERVTILCPPPTLLRTTGCQDPEAALPSLSLLYVGGEALPRDVADRWARGRCLVNGYGPTECTVTALRTRIKEGESISIGRPVRGLRARVLNEALEEVRDGDQGELCLAGIGLARGYRNQPELTTEKFPVHPKFGRIYRTGDLAHRGPDGTYFYHGRIDSQVKLRGYRVELEAIEARLAECDGVREAACRVQGEGANQALVGFVVPADVDAPPSFDGLKASLRKILPAYMVPCRFGILSELPKTVGGKLNRKALPLIEAQERDEEHGFVQCRDEMEEKIAALFHKVLEGCDRISVHDDFFSDLGGDSLSAAVLVSLLRDDPQTASIALLDLYESRTVAELARRARGAAGTEVGAGTEADAEEELAYPGWRPLLATAIQALWLLMGLMLGTPLAYAATFYVLPFLTRSLGLVPSILLGPLLLFLALAIYTPVAAMVVLLVKRLIIGRYRPLRAPVWGSFYIRNWIVQHTAKILPWWLLEGTVFQNALLRALGASIGHGVHIHRGVNLLQGGWDLLEIGDDVTVSQDASIRLVELEDGHLIVGAVSLGEGSTLDVHSGVGGNTCLEPYAYLAAMSSLPRGGRIPRGERWDGIPAKPTGKAPPKPEITGGEAVLSPEAHGVALIFARCVFDLILVLPFQLIDIAFLRIYGIDTEAVLEWLSSPSLNLSVFVTVILLVILSMPLTLALEAMAARAIGRVSEGVISRWGIGYIRIWLKTGWVHSAGAWLYGTLFWPVWLRWAGMKVGPGCEISTLIDAVPELVEIGPKTFCADGIYLGGPRVHRGAVTLAAVRLGKNSFFGNRVVIAGAQRLPDDVLLGICTVSDAASIRAGTSWFGHPPFELPRREVVECDRRFTHEPSLIRYLNRVFWELLRFALPIITVLLFFCWYELLARAEATLSWPVFLLMALPLVSLAMTAFSILTIVAVKWVLLGRVRPGVHPLWSCWASRWDFVCMAWGFYAEDAVAALEGTLFLSVLLRAMGVRIGRNVVIGGGFAYDLVDPDMLSFEDGATVDCSFQTHTFEDRVLKIDRVKIRSGASVGRNATLLYGADIGARTCVSPHSVVMKYERLLPGRSYVGFPTRPSTSREGPQMARVTETKLRKAATPILATASGEKE